MTATTVHPPMKRHRGQAVAALAFVIGAALGSGATVLVDDDGTGDALAPVERPVAAETEVGTSTATAVARPTSADAAERWAAEDACASGTISADAAERCVTSR